MIYELLILNKKKRWEKNLMVGLKCLNVRILCNLRHLAKKKISIISYFA